MPTFQWLSYLNLNDVQAEPKLIHLPFPADGGPGINMNQNLKRSCWPCENKVCWVKRQRNTLTWGDGRHFDLQKMLKVKERFGRPRNREPPLTRMPLQAQVSVAACPPIMQSAQEHAAVWETCWQGCSHIWVREINSQTSRQTQNTKMQTKNVATFCLWLLCYYQVLVNLCQICSRCDTLQLPTHFENVLLKYFASHVHTMEAW